MSRKKLYVVEGKSDTNRLKQINPSIITFETSGLGFDEEKQQKLVDLSREYEIVVLTDPDTPGEKIRERVKQLVPNSRHIYLDSRQAKSKNKVGVEHANLNVLKEALGKELIEVEAKKNYQIADLISWGIYANRQKRADFCKLINISYGNNQKVLKQLNNFGIDEKQINSVLQKIKEING